MSGYIGQAPTPQATQTRQTFTATAAQTTFNTIGYTPGFLDVFLNGVKLVDGTDYTATNGSDVVLTTGAASGDILEVVAFSTFVVSNGVDKSGDTMTGDLTVPNLTASGGVYLGGTGSANKLDDYEEGTWTGNCSTGSCSVLNANYIKVGNLVTAVCRAESFTDTSSSANVTINGLPYTAANGDFTGAIIAKGLSNTNLSACYTGAGQSSVTFYGVHSGGFLALRHLDLTSTTQIYFTITYTTS